MKTSSLRNYSISSLTFSKNGNKYIILQQDMVMYTIYPESSPLDGYLNLYKYDICSYHVLSSILFHLLPFRVFSLDVISGNKGFMLSKLAGCWLAVTWVQNIAEFSDKRRLVCEPRFIASRSSHTLHHHHLQGCLQFFSTGSIFAMNS